MESDDPTPRRTIETVNAELQAAGCSFPSDQSQGQAGIWERIGMQCNAMQQVCNLFLLYPSKQTKETPHLPLFDKIAAKNNALSFALTVRKEP